VDRQRLRPIFFLLFLAGVAAAWALTPIGDRLTFTGLREAHQGLVALVEARPLLCIAGFFLGCVAATTFCFPAAPVIGLAAGALFGFWIGLATVLAASSIGSTGAFQISRYLIRDSVKARLGSRMATIDRGVRRRGGCYLLALRFNPLIPYWLVNLAMGVTRMRLVAYIPLTVIGLMPATIIYVDAGTRLATLDEVGDVASPTLIAALLFLCLFPLLARGAWDRLRPGERGVSSSG
jgi:uncharacterized membrane protein YdjX (TVP38/TMEM64 family)